LFQYILKRAKICTVYALNLPGGADGGRQHPAWPVESGALYVRAGAQEALRLTLDSNVSCWSAVVEAAAAVAANSAGPLLPALGDQLSRERTAIMQHC
jgi:hypothetical protein